MRFVISDRYVLRIGASMSLSPDWPHSVDNASAPQLSTSPQKPILLVKQGRHAAVLIRPETHELLLDDVAFSISGLKI